MMKMPHEHEYAVTLTRAEWERIYATLGAVGAMQGYLEVHGMADHTSGATPLRMLAVRVERQVREAEKERFAAMAANDLLRKDKP